MPYSVSSVNQNTEQKDEPCPKDKPRIWQMVSFMEDPEHTADPKQKSYHDRQPSIVKLHRFHEIRQETIIRRGRRRARCPHRHNAGLLNLVCASPEIGRDS